MVDAITLLYVHNPPAAETFLRKLDDTTELETVRTMGDWFADNQLDSSKWRAILDAPTGSNRGHGYQMAMLVDADPDEFLKWLDRGAVVQVTLSDEDKQALMQLTTWQTLRDWFEARGMEEEQIIQLTKMKRKAKAANQQQFDAFQAKIQGVVGEDTAELMTWAMIWTMNHCDSAPLLRKAFERTKN